MRRFFTLAVAATAFCAAITGLFSPPVRAASGGLTISPTSIDQRVAPGGSFDSEIFIINQGQLDYKYKMYVTPYSVTGEDYKPYFTPIEGAVDATKWFTLGKSGGQLAIGNQDTIPVTVRVPEGTAAGAYYATVFAETDDQGAGSGVVTRKRVGTVVYINVTGRVSEKGQVASWSVPWLQKGPLTATLRQANSGSVYYTADVNVTISDVFGGPKFTFQRQPHILPQKQRRIDVQWQNGATFGLFKVSGEVKYLGKTEKLGTQYVFVANTQMRVVTVAVILVFVASMVFIGTKRVVRKK